MYQFMRALVMGTGIYRKQQRKTQLGVDHVRVRQRAGANLEVCRKIYSAIRQRHGSRRQIAEILL